MIGNGLWKERVGSLGKGDSGIASEQCKKRMNTRKRKRPGKIMEGERG